MNKQNKEIKAFVKNAKKAGYFNIMIEVDGFKCEVAPKFLNNKQKALLRHKLATLIGGNK